MFLLFCCGLWTVICIFIFHNHHRKRCPKTGMVINRYGGGCDGPEAKALERLTSKSRRVVRSIATTEVGIRITRAWDGTIHQLVQHTERPAVSTNKRSIRLCLGKDAATGDDNKYMFIVLHEIAHLGTKSIGHTREFWDVFAFLLRAAEAQGAWSSEAHDPSSIICGKEIGGIPM